MPQLYVNIDSVIYIYNTYTNVYIYNITYTTTVTTNFNQSTFMYNEYKYNLYHLTHAMTIQKDVNLNIIHQI